MDDTGRDGDGRGTTGAAAQGQATNGNARLQEEFVERWRTNAYGCFSSGHKF